MSLTHGSRPSRLAFTALALGALAMLIAVAGFLWTATVDGEASFGPIFIVGCVLAVFGLGGLVIAIVGIVRHAHPRWMNVVGLLLSAMPLAFGVYVLVAFVTVLLVLSPPTIP